MTIDLWSSYLGITAHYVQDYKLISAMHAYKRFKRRHHTAASIYTPAPQISGRPSTSHKRSLLSYPTRESNMTKAFSLSGFNATSEPTVVYSGTDYESYDDIESNETSLEPNEDVFEFSQNSSTPCLPILLCVKDGMKYAGSICKVIAKASAIVTRARKSTHDLI
jgi:hypothetical protein